MRLYQWFAPFIYLFEHVYPYSLFDSCETPTKEPMELAVISNFHHRRPLKGVELWTT